MCECVPDIARKHVHWKVPGLGNSLAVQWLRLLLQWEGKKKRVSFFFLSLYWEQRQTEQWASLNIPSFPTLTASNSACQYLSLLFGPLTLRSYTSHLFSFDRMLNTSCVWYLSLQHPSPCNYISERRLKSHQMARINHWVTDSSLRLSLKQCKRKNSSS